MDCKTGFKRHGSKYNDDIQFEEHILVLDNAMNELKKYLDQMLEMRLQCAELELDLATMYKPDLKCKIMQCQQTCNDCKGLILYENPDEENGIKYAKQSDN